MDVRIKSIHFDVTEKLTEFINKKIERVERRFPNVASADVTLKVVKPESAMNKDVTIKFNVPQQGEMVANKVADTFEEAVDNALEALGKQLEKFKNMK